MSQDWLQDKQVPPYVRLGTIRDMASVARKLAMIRAGVQEVNNIEIELQKKTIDPREAIRNVTDVVLKIKGWSGETTDVLKEIKRNVETYLRDLKNASN